MKPTYPQFLLHTHSHPPVHPPLAPTMMCLLLCPFVLRPGCERRYHFSPFTCTLNEMEEGVASTDSRFRPDQRALEEGDFEKANTEKVRIDVNVEQIFT